MRAEPWLLSVAWVAVATQRGMGVLLGHKTQDYLKVWRGPFLKDVLPFEAEARSMCGFSMGPGYENVHVLTAQEKAMLDDRVPGLSTHRMGHEPRSK
jgi:hypothetical protein